MMPVATSATLVFIRDLLWVKWEGGRVLTSREEFRIRHR